MPTLRPGDIVVMDNLEKNRAPWSGAPSAPPVRGSSCCRSICPDLNPFEKLFAEALALAPQGRRPYPGRRLCDAISHILDTVTASECGNYLVEAGYAPA